MLSLICFIYEDIFPMLYWGVEQTFDNGVFYFFYSNLLCGKFSLILVSFRLFCESAFKNNYGNNNKNSNNKGLMFNLPVLSNVQGCYRPTVHTALQAYTLIVWHKAVDLKWTPRVNICNRIAAEFPSYTVYEETYEHIISWSRLGAPGVKIESTTPLEYQS